MKPYPDLFTIIHSLVGGQLTGGEDISEYIYHDGQTPPTQAEIDTKKASMLSDWETESYVRNRQNDYPDWDIQLEKIYDDGVTKWKSEMVDPVKAKWPKDNSGPV